MTRRIAAEAIGTALLLAAVVGSGIMGERLAGGNVAIALLANTLATGAMLVALILTFGPISGAHFNPAVTLADRLAGRAALDSVKCLASVIAAQIAGAFAGVAAAHLMFGEAVFSASRHVRSGGANVQRVCRNIRTARGDPGMCTVSLDRRSIRGGRLHHRRVLVHVVDILCQPGCNPGTLGNRYLCRDTACRCPGLHRGATGRGRGGNVPLSLAVASSAKGSCMIDKKRVLILCTGNSARSQMAEGLLRHDASDRFDVVSAGIKRSRSPSELAIAAMRELGIDISGQRSKNVDEFANQHFDYGITVCDNARETCPVFFGDAKQLHRSFEDPPPPHLGTHGERMAIFRRVRDELREYLREFSKAS